MSDVRDRGPRPLYQLDDDAKAGFRTAVQNGQVRLAVEYARVVIGDQQDQINKLRTELDELKGQVSELVTSPTATAERAARRSAPAKEEVATPTPG